ncbi:MAG TPA: phospholipase D-like domain-containing protein [Thermodesulfobacteriota bacterium]
MPRTLAPAAGVLVLVALAIVPLPAAAGHRALCFTGPPSGADCLAKLLEYMDAENAGIDVMMYRWSDWRYTDRLIAKHRAGKRVRVIIDRSQYLENAKFHAQVDRLAAAGVPIRITRHRGVTHSKTTLLRGQGRLVLAVYHPVGGIRNWEMHFALQDPEALGRMVERFDRAWHNVDPQVGTFAPFSRGMRLRTEAEMAEAPTASCYEDPDPDPNPLPDDATYDLCFSGDENCQASQLAPAIDGEADRLDVAIYAMSSSSMRDALVRFARSGRPLRLIVDGARAREPAMRGTLRAVLAAGPSGNVRIKADVASTSMHLKMVVGSTWVAFGSSNYRDGSTTRVRGCQSRDYSENDLMLVRHRAVRDEARARFDRLWSSRDFAPFTP